MKQVVTALVVMALALVGCAPSLSIPTTSQDAVLYAGNAAEIRNTLLNEVRNYSPGAGYNNWQWDSTTPNNLTFASVKPAKELSLVDWALVIFTGGLYYLFVAEPERRVSFTCQLVGGESRTSVVCSPAYKFVYDILDAKYPRTQ